MSLNSNIQQSGMGKVGKTPYFYYFRHGGWHNEAANAQEQGFVAGKSYRSQASQVEISKTFLQPMATLTSHENLQLLVTKAFARATGVKETYDKLAKELVLLHSPTTGLMLGFI